MTPDKHPPMKTKGKSRISKVLFLMAIIAIAILLFLWFATWAQHHALLAKCGRTQASIIGSIIAFEEPGSGDWWPSFPRTNASGKATKVSAKDPHEARLVSVGIMANLAITQSIPNIIFTCPAIPETGPKRKYDPATMTPEAWGATPGSSASYAIDWAAPIDQPGRILIADRDPQNHDWEVAACFGDSHVTVLKGYQVPLAETMKAVRTENNEGKPASATTAEPKDDIYSPAPGDVKMQLTQGGGDPDHAWVK
jgi:hypothetical protein